VKYEIWAENLLETGMEGIPQKAFLIAKDVEADSFQEACDKAIPLTEYAADYDSEKLKVWCLSLYDNEADANWIRK
jgi:hypothetical protein